MKTNPYGTNLAGYVSGDVGRGKGAMPDLEGDRIQEKQFRTY
jgi:hypothetical protein